MMRQLKIEKRTTDRSSKSVDNYMKDVSGLDMVSPEEEVELAKRIKDGDDEALERLVNANLRFVISVAKQYQFPGTPLEDLISAGNLGLVKAAKRYDHTTGFKFISYAVWWIRQSIQQYLYENSRSVRIPVNGIGNIRKVRNAIEVLNTELGRHPTVDEICKEVDIPEEKVKKSISLMKNAVRLDAKLPGEDDRTGTTYMDVMTELHNGLDFDNIKTQDHKSVINSYLSRLSNRERDMIEMYFGLNGKRQHSYKEISEEKGVVTETIRGGLRRALMKLRKMDEGKDNLRQFIG